MASPHASTDTPTGTSSRKDVRKADLVERAKYIIGEYKNLMEGTYAEADPLLNRALAATYAAVLDLQKHPDLMELFLDDKRSGPVSKNPIKPIVRKLWQKVHTRDTLHRYASCLAYAQREKVKPAEFVTWVADFTIKKAAAKWSSIENTPDERVKAASAQTAKRDQLLTAMKSIPLPVEIGNGFQAGIHLAAMRVSPEGKAELFVFNQIAPSSVDAFIIRNAR